MNLKKADFRSIFLGTADYVKNGELIRDSAVRMVFVSSSDELNNLKPHYPPGTIAVQMGLEHAWQLSADKTWISIL